MLDLLLWDHRTTIRVSSAVRERVCVSRIVTPQRWRKAPKTFLRPASVSASALTSVRNTAGVQVKQPPPPSPRPLAVWWREEVTAAGRHEPGVPSSSSFSPAKTERARQFSPSPARRLTPLPWWSFNPPWSEHDRAPQLLLLLPPKSGSCSGGVHAGLWTDAAHLAPRLLLLPLPSRHLSSWGLTLRDHPDPPLYLFICCS